MARTAEGPARRPRISIEIGPEVRRQLDAAAAEHDVTVSRYVRDAILARLGHDAGRDGDDAGSLSAASDPTLAELWDNPHDAAYDELWPRRCHSGRVHLL